MVYKSGASTSSEYVEKIDDISKKSSAHGGHKSDDESTTTVALSVNIKTPPKIDNGINFESKRKLRTSRRLNSLNPDSLPQPPLPAIEKTIDSVPSNHQQTIANIVLAQPLCAPKPIRNRRYTINECSNATGLRDGKDVTVPFQAKNKQDTIVLNNCVTNTATASRNKSDRKRSCDDLNLLGDRLNCSVSLERLTGIIDTLVYQTNSSNRTDDANGGNNGGGNKILCLYCDRSFSSQKLYGKHLERLHESTSGRRLSARTSNSETAGVTYPGCFYCNSGKVASLSGAELIQLVHHLVDEHRDKYYACKSCMIRYPSRDQLQLHLSKEHKIDNNRKSSTSSLTKRNAKKVQSPVEGVDTTSVDDIAADDDIADEPAVSEPTLRSLRLRRSNDANKKTATTTASNKPQLLTSEETFLSRLGIAQNRSPRSRKGAKNRRGCSSELFPLETSRVSRSNKNSKSTQQNLVSETIEFNAPKVSNNKCEPVASVFDEDFYESVNLNVKLNLSCHLDGKLKTGGDEDESDNGDGQSVTPCSLNAVENVPAVRSILVKSPVFAETEIHEATTTISAFTAFPTLLTAQQYGAEFQAGKMKKPITKNSWKWKWDCVKKYKYVNEGGKIVKKVKQPLAGLRDLSKLDMWTQLTMRMKHETVSRQVNELGGSFGGDDSLVAVGEAAREEKRKLIAQLNQILDKRVLPQINVEQSDQTIIKIEFPEQLAGSERTLMTHIGESDGSDNEPGIVKDWNFPASLRLFKRDHSANTSKSPIVLSGEWARPRCYICVSCGSRFATVRSLEEHKASKHPFVHSTHYEIVGKELIDGDLFRNFYIPSMALQRHNEYNQTVRLEKSFFGSNALCGVSAGGGDDSMDSVTSFSLSITKSDSIDLDSNSRNSKVSVSSTGTATSSSLSIIIKSDSDTISDQLTNNCNGDVWQSSSVSRLETVKCSKCDRECNGTMDLYRHMLDCSSDYAWLLAKKRNHIKYRYFGSRRRRTHRNSMSNTRKTIKPKKERDATSDGSSSASKSKEPTTPRPRPSEAESIQRMLENLPAKRAARQIFPNLTPKPMKNKKFVSNAITRSGKILVKQKTAGGTTRAFKILSTNTTVKSDTIRYPDDSHMTSKWRSSGDRLANLVLRKRRNVDHQLRLKRSTDAVGIVTIRRTRATAAENSKSVAGSSGNSGDTKKKMIGVTKKSTRKDGKSEIGNVIRRRTKAVVKKITSTFRKGNKKHIVRTSTSCVGGDKVTAIGTATSKSNEPQKKRKLLRSISFRRSMRNIRKSDASKLPPKVTTVATAAVVEEKTVSKDEGVKPTECVKQTEEQISSRNVANETNVTDAASKEEEECSQAKIENVPEPPLKLKRKRSIKTIINDIRAKCQSKTNTNETKENDPTPTSTSMPAPLSTVVENEAKPSSETTAPIPQISVTSPLSLTIETNDEPLNLCVASRERNDVDKIVTPATSSSSLSVPATTPVSANQQQSESISPRRRTRKINDCIAMLTGKLQEKLGVPFIDQSSSLLAVLGSEVSSKTEPQVTSGITSTTIEQLTISQEKPASDVPAAATEIVECKNASELSSTVESAENIRSEPKIGDSVDAEQQMPELQEPADSSQQPNEDEKLADSQLESISENDEKEPEKTETRRIEEVAIDQNLLVETVASVVDATETEELKNTVDDKTVLEIVAELPSQEEPKSEIIDTETIEVNETVAKTIEASVAESTKQEIESKEIVVAKKTPNLKSRSTTPKTKATKPKEKPAKKSGKKANVVVMTVVEANRINEEPKSDVVVNEICDQSLNENSVIEPTVIPPETHKIEELKPEETIVKDAIVESLITESSTVEANADISHESTKIEESNKTKTPKSKKTATRKASAATKSLENPVSDEKSQLKVVENDVTSSDAMPNVETIEIPPSKSIPKEKKKSRANAKQRTAAATKARLEKSAAKMKAMVVHEDEPIDDTPPKSKRTAPSSRKSQAVAIDSIFESSDEELLPWDPETGFIKEPDSSPSQTPSSIAATFTPTPSIATSTPTPSIAATSTPTPSFAATIADTKPKKKRKNELAQLLPSTTISSRRHPDDGHLTAKRLSSVDRVNEMKTNEKKSRAQSPKVDTKKTPEAKEATLEQQTPIEEPVDVEEAKLKQKPNPKSNKSRSKRNEIENNTQSVTCDNSTLSSPPIETEEIAEDDKATEPPALMPPKIIENVENAPKKSSGNIFLDGFSETLFGDADKNSLKATVDNEATAATTTPSITTTTTATNVSLKAPVIFGESLFSQQNLKSTRLSDLIGSTNNKIVEAATKVSPMKNKSVENLISFDKLGEIKSTARAPFMSPRWDSNATDDKTENKNKVNFWSRTIGDDKTPADNQKSRLFAVIKNKAEKMFTKMSKKKLKKSLKASISASSSSSTSSSASSNAIPKRPLLRPSILSCNSTTPVICSQQLTPPPDVVNESTLLIASAAIPPVAVPTAGRKIGSIRRKTVKLTEEPVDDPKSPIESDMNIAKIVIALEKSNRKSNADESLLNNAFIAVDHRSSNAPFKEQQQQQQKPLAVVVNLKAQESLDIEKTATLTPPLRVVAPSSITTDLLNDSSQDTMISEIVSKIREKVNRTDSDDDLCLADVAKGLSNRSPSVEFDLTSRPKVDDFSNLKLDSAAQLPVNDELGSTKVITDPSENDVDTADDENTNTEVLDMDLEDDASEYTALSHDTSTTSIGGSKKRKRKKRSILSRSNRRTKKRDDSFVLPAETYFCDVCRKSFKNQSGLTSHRTTITHIAKLSEQEFLEAKKSVDVSPNENYVEQKSTVNEPATDTDVTLSPQKESTTVFEPVADDLTNSTSSQPLDGAASPPQQPQSQQNEMSSFAALQHKCNATQVDRQCKNNAVQCNALCTCCGEKQRNASQCNALCVCCVEKQNTTTATSHSMTLTLSQEQRLFYECCSMLKGSDRTTTTTSTVHENNRNELASNPITPKTNQHHTNIAHSAQSPRSHPSPRPGIPTLDLNQFSDISSDSNPAYSCPQIPSSSKTQKVFSLDASELSKTDADREMVGTRISKSANYQYAKNQSQQKCVSEKAKGDADHRNSSIIVRNYPDTFSDMGDSFPSSQDASGSENYAQTILERSVHIHDGAAMNNSMRSGHSSKVNDGGYTLTSVPETLHSDLTEFQSCSNRSNFDSPIHSTSSQSSSISRPRTKAAMKGYEDLKVSIPTTGLDMQQALERSPNAGANSCKLATLADIALGNDVPVCLERTVDSCADKSIKASPKTVAVNEKSATKKSLAAEAKKAEALRLSGELTPKGKKRTHKNTGHLLGFRERKKRPRPAGKDKMKHEKSLLHSIELEPKQKDVYDFEETQDSTDTTIAPLTHTRPSKIDSTTETKTASNSTNAKADGGTKKVCDDPEDESSYSDRDDYYNFNSMSGSGTEDDGVATESESLKSLKSAKSLKIGQLQKKCLIMGRIFKKAKNSAKPMTENTDKEVAKPIPKKQLDEIFDNLRTSPIKITSNATKEKHTEKKAEKVVNTPTVIANDDKHASATLEPPNDNAAQHLNQAAAVGGDSVPGKSRKSREVANLEAEWGMSMEQIKELIGVGKRKTQRRCATNRKNKFMETWSSDEYEEFHSTKDIIALIEEAEMKAKRAKARAAKSSNANASSVTATATATTTTTTTATVTMTANISVGSANVTEVIKEKEPSTEQNATIKTTEMKNDKENSKKCKNKIDECEPKMDASSNKQKSKKTTTFSGVRSDDSDFDEHWNKTAKRAKIRNRRRTIASREDMLDEEKPKTKPRSKSKQTNTTNTNVDSGNKICASAITASEKTVPAVIATEKKKEINAMEIHPKQNAPTIMPSTAAAAAAATNKKPAKPMPRRKRIASEMLYYWSSSSDEEFGRIKQSENEDGETSDNHIEQHGWIVGDSHKKLVTLLAHAKGKKIDDCAVKEAAHKKK